MSKNNAKFFVCPRLPLIRFIAFRFPFVFDNALSDEGDFLVERKAIDFRFKKPRH